MYIYVYVCNMHVFGLVFTAGNSHCMNLWGTKASVPLHIVHFGFGFGSAVGPFLILPFIGANNGTAPVSNGLTIFPDVSKVATYFSSLDGHETAGNSFLSTFSNTSDSANIREPFAIAGGFGVLVALLLTIFIFIPWPEYLKDAIYSTNSTPEEEHAHHSSWRHFSIRACFPNESALYGISILLLLIAFYVGMCGQANSLGVYLYAIAVDSSLGFTAREGTLLIVLYNSVYALGRGAAIFVNIFIKVQVFSKTYIIVMEYR